MSSGAELPRARPVMILVGLILVMIPAALMWPGRICDERAFRVEDPAAKN